MAVFIFGPHWLASTKQVAARAEARVDLQLELTGRYAVGAKALVVPKEAPADNAMLASLRKAVKSSAGGHDPVRQAVLLGEMGDPQGALAELDAAPGNAADVAALRQVYQEGPQALDNTQRAGLVAHYGWFGRLALGYGQPADSPARREAIAPAIRMVLATWALIGAGGLGVLAGVILLVLGIIFYARGVLRPHYHPRPGWTSVFLEGFAIYLGGMGVLGLGLRALWPKAPLSAEWILLILLPVVFLWPRFRGVSWGELWGGLGWNRGAGVWREIGAGVAGYVAAMPLLAVGIVLVVYLSKLAGEQPVHPIVYEARGGWVHILGLYLLACVWAPVVEETMFRGALYHHLRQRWGWIISTLVVAFIFAIIHPQGGVALPVLGSLAIALATIREWRGSIIGCMTAHALNNAVAVTLLVIALG
jgi:membrane protease YdiL (CAAX protease family)